MSKKEPIDQFHFDVERINPLYREQIRTTAIKWGFDKQTNFVKAKGQTTEEYFANLTKMKDWLPENFLEFRHLPGGYDLTKGPDNQDWQIWPVMPEPCLEALGEILNLFRSMGIAPFSKKKIKLISE